MKRDGEQHPEGETRALQLSFESFGWEALDAEVSRGRALRKVVAAACLRILPSLASDAMSARAPHFKPPLALCAK